MVREARKEHDRVVFLDRDGVINREPPDPGWVFRWEDLEFADGALAALRRLRESGFTVVVVSNQSCVGRGLATLGSIQDVMDKMVAAVAAAGGEIPRVYWCPHVDADGCECRKPKAGMVERAERELALRADRAFLVGDRDTDMEMGASKGCTTLLVERGKASQPDQADYVVGSLGEAVERILTLVDG
jgi:D-glycero-D-manno-heptose 1,7-bisphosphate phosphatase